jgi:hypothetical protein
MDDFGWFGFAEAARRCSLGMAAVLSSRLNLEQLLTRLLEHPGSQQPQRRRLADSIGFDESR